MHSSNINHPPLTSIADGSGTIDFEEFYSWWNSPEAHTLKNPKLAGMRVDLQAKGKFF